MRIGIIGAGNVGRALGQRFAALGHAVSYGVRDPNGRSATSSRAASSREFAITLLRRTSAP